MADLRPTTALGAETPRNDRIGGADICENVGLSLASLALRRGQTLDRLDLPLPGPGNWVRSGGWTALWLGPDQWMMMAEGEELSDRRLDKVSGKASVTDQTDAWVCFDLTAPHASAILTRLTMLDVEEMQNGEGGRSVIEHLGCLLICLETGHQFRILGPRSSATSLHHALKTAATSLAIRKD